MKTLYRSTRVRTTAFLILLTNLVTAQNFSPFNASVTKRFYNSANPADNSYFFYADSSHQPAPGVTVFHQYFTLQASAGTVDVSGCGFWAGGGTQVIDTTWLGVDITYDSNLRQLVLVNGDGHPLSFDFSLPPGDSSKFYDDASNMFYIKAGPVQAQPIYATTDSVKSFTILHYDFNNQVVLSPLHGKVIMLGQQTGLISFIETYHFPGMERHLTLLGQLNPLIGTYQMRFEDLYPFQVGDSVQYQGNNSPEPCGYIRNYRVLSRNETADSVTIVFGKSVHYMNSPQTCNQGLVLDAYPATLKFPKNSDLVGFPYNRVHGQSQPLRVIGNPGGYEFRTEDSSQTHCGKRLSIKGQTDPLRYCESCKCLGSVDANSFSQGLQNIKFNRGIGIYSIGLKVFTISGQKQRTMTMNYSTVGGQVCGVNLPVGLPGHDLEGIFLYPSPVTDQLTISAPVDQVTVFSSDGRLVQNFDKPHPIIVIGHFAPGIYVFRISKGEFVTYSRIIKF